MSYKLQPSTFNFQPSTFNLQSSNFKLQTSLISYTFKCFKFAIKIKATTPNPQLRVVILSVEYTTPQRVTKSRWQDCYGTFSECLKPHA